MRLLSREALPDPDTLCDGLRRIVCLTNLG